MELELRQEQQLSMRQLHSLRLLQMGRLEIREYLETVALKQAAAAAHAG